MAEVSLPRLYALRALYLLMAVGLGLVIWPRMFHHQPWEVMRGAAYAMLSAVGLLAILGLRYPLRMLPLLFFELAWKCVWLLAVALPAWSSGQMDADTADTVRDCLLVVLVPIAIPWRYVWTNYVTARGDRWR